MLLSTETNSVVSFRAKKLCISVLQGVGGKKAVLLNYGKDNNINAEEILYVGNDINDLGAMRIVGGLDIALQMIIPPLNSFLIIFLR